MKRKPLKHFLNVRGLTHELTTTRCSGFFCFCVRRAQAFRVQVRRGFLKYAMDLLETEPGVSALLQKAVHCPDCGSLRVEYPQMTRKFLLPTLLLHLGIIFRVIKHECYCDSCHCIWNLPERLPATRPVPC